ncbi:phosphatidylserine decarboxylase [Methylovirgula ligni]|uniref:Phosphatidylserine decarboxylase n=1 Tax=Methylovirgula ligni TaxID=569860 RepID=A0A3D9Z4E5_9HYPH|nr:DUF1254 domain-containing protein [Methylovirgula ligni]QAY96273.1 phosphatidylserine decarboxylase [Methylovirgula ligni]REF86019.1 hypothetical protein DES32_2061 [Methylovirgula ligni]
MTSGTNGTIFSRGASRRDILRQGFALPAAASLAMLTKSSFAIAADDDLATLHLAYRYGLPLYDNARVTYLVSQSPLNPLRVAPNFFLHGRKLADYHSRLVTTPNTDTLYSVAIVDLTAGPVLLKVPEFGKRYYSIALIDAFTNNSDYVGSRATGGQAATYVIVPPGYDKALPDGAKRLHANTPHTTLLVRILIDGPDDYDDVHDLQNGLKLTQANTPPAPSLIAPDPRDPENFVALVNQVLRINPPPAADQAALKRLAAVGVGAESGALTASQKALWAKYFDEAQKALLAEIHGFGATHDGWTYLPSDVGNFGTDYATRAAIAITGLWVNIPAEAVYTFAGLDSKGEKLVGSKNYRLRLPAGAPPTDSFWSLSIYEVEPDGRLFFTDNPLHRYAISDRTQGLKKNADGSLDIFIQRASPGGDKESNWLPAPEGDFRLVARAYLPRPELLDGRFKYPSVEPVA